MVMGLVGRWAALSSALGFVALVSCSDSSDGDGGPSTAGAGSGAGGSGGKSTAGSAGTKPTGPGGAGGAGASGGGVGGNERGPCEDYKTEAACEAAGCVPTTGTLSKVLPAGEGGAAGLAGAGGAGGSRFAGAACEQVEDVFISCEEGFGGAVFNTACNDSCTACLGGPWTVGRHAPYTKQDCEDWSCVDGKVETGAP